MFKYLVNLLLIVSMFPGNALAIDINGQLKNAQMEQSASDPVTNVVESRFYWNSTSKKPMVYNGTDWAEMGSAAGGSGEKTYIDNPSGAVSTTGWTCVGDLDIARTATATDLPRENTTATGLKITADANVQSVADYCYYDFTLDDIDLNRKLNVKFATKQTGSYVASNLAVVITTQADRTTAVATPVVTNIAAADYDFDANGFDTSSTTTLSLVIRATADMTTDAGIVISDVIVGPGKIQAVPASGYLGELAFTLSNNGSKTFTVNNQCWRKDNLLTCEFFLDGDTTASGSAATDQVTLNLPSGYTTDLTAVASGTASATANIGRYTEYGIKTATTYSLQQRQVALSTNSVRFLLDDGANFIKISDLNVARDMNIQGSFTVPIAEWAGAPNYAGSNDVEYAYNTSTSTTVSDTASFAYGRSGALIQAITATISRRVRFQTAIAADDRLWVELSKDQISWITPGGYVNGSSIDGSRYDGTNAIGVGLNKDAATAATDIDAVFGKYASGVTSAWGATIGAYYWRVVKAKAGAAVGFGAATATASGLVSREVTTTISSTFQGNLGGSASSSVTIRVMRVGNTVTLDIPTMTSVVPTTSSVSLNANTALPTWAWPAATKNAVTVVYDNGAYPLQTGVLNIGATGILKFYKTINAAAYTNSANAGWYGLTVSYYVD